MNAIVQWTIHTHTHRDINTDTDTDTETQRHTYLAMNTKNEEMTTDKQWALIGYYIQHNLLAAATKRSALNS